MGSTLRLAVAQLNCTVGDFTGNVQRIVLAAKQAAEGGASILLTPELALCGYPPEDLLLRQSFLDHADQALISLKQQLAAFPQLHVVVGHPSRHHGRLFNAASVLHAGAVTHTYAKRDLPNYRVFDEQRYFQSAEQACVFELQGVRFGINICEDTWLSDAPAAAAQAGAQVLLVLNASPFHLGKSEQRLDVTRERVSAHGMALVYANMVGGQDELVFDGGSFALDGKGECVSRARSFDEDLMWVNLDKGQVQAGLVHAPLQADAAAYSALVLGVRDYLQKNRFPGAIIGLSGGIDSALTLAVAVDALGAERVRAVMMPSDFTADISVHDARDMATRLGVDYQEISIRPIFQSFLDQLQPHFAGAPWDSTEENLQARARGTLLMALSNKSGSIVLTTGNKSEMAVGYCTLYGDMAGGFAVIKDLTKQWVYRLSRYRNGVSPVIPERIIDRAPSAELRPNQTDQDSLPPYEILDAIIQNYMEEDRSLEDLLAMGFPPEAVRQVVRLIRLSEYKRRQAPIGIRVTQRAFGRDWRYPITNRFQEERA